MRITTKLLLTYLVLIGIAALAAFSAIPRWVESSVIRTEQDRLNSQVQVLANRITSRLPGGPGAGARNVRDTLSFVEQFLTEESVGIVDTNGVVVLATTPELAGKVIPPLPGQGTAGRRFTTRGSLPVIPGLGPAVVAAAPLGGTAPGFLQGYTLVMVRDLSFIQEMAGPIALRMGLVLVLIMAVSAVVITWISQDLVRRLQATGRAAQAFAEGDLTRRAPEQGHDEVTDLAGRFNQMADRLQMLVEGLRRSEQARKDLLVTVSHELRTPITSIAGFAEALRDGVVREPDKQQHTYRIISSEAARLNRLIQTLFDVAKLDAGQSELNLHELPAAEWLSGFAEHVQPAAAHAGVEVAVQISPDAAAARIHGDRDRLDQVMTNLVSNAIRYSPKGETVLLKADVDGRTLLVEVIDRGPGLAPEEAAHVFDRFYRGSHQVEGYKGAGLGLAIVRSLVEAHGGTVGVRSVQGAGATFWFRLPLA